MPFRRRSKDNTKAHAAIDRACIETLESRCMLTAVINGLFQGTGTQFDGQTIFEYAQPNGDDPIRISVSGNLTAEFIGAVFDPAQPDQLTLADLSTPNAWLFSIYVAKADTDCTISIAGLTDAPIHMDPFLTGQPIQTTTAGLVTTIGAAYIGAETPDTLQGNAGNVPLIRSDERVFGMRPTSAGELFAGLEVAPNNDLGRFYLGGTITGLVDIWGSCQELYANNILTGNAEGIGSGSTSDIHKNFHVGGDLENLMTLSSFGTNTLVDTQDVNLTNVDYNTGFQLDVGGRLGQAKAGDSFNGQMVVHHSNSAPSTGLPQSEIEIRGAAFTGNASYFDPQFMGNQVAIGAYTPATLFNNNDTFDAAQWLGTLRSSELKKNSMIQLKGTLGVAGDATDFYAVNLLAGQSMDVTLVGDGVRVQVFDPDDRQIYTDVSNIHDGTRIGKTVRIKADRPGAYRIAATGAGNYELRVTGVGDIAMGGLIAENHIGTNNAAVVNPGTGAVTGVTLQVLNGDLGEVRAGLLDGGTIFSAPGTGAYYVPAGNLRAIEASTVGIDDGTTIVLRTGPELAVPNGSVGLLRNTGTNQTLAINDDQLLVPSVNGDDLVFPSSSSDLSTTPKKLAVGGDYQLVDSAGSVDGALIARGSIGVIRAVDAGRTGISFPVWQVNVDGSGKRGTIDLVDVTGTLFSPAITTGPGGNVRYMRVLGGITRDPFFGGGSPEPTLYAPGEKALFTDDSGTSIALTPIPLIKNTVFGAGQPKFIDPGQLTVLGYPIRDKAGQVLISVSVSPVLDTVLPAALGGGGIQIESGTAGSGGSVEIGQLTLAGGTSSGTLVFDPFLRTYTFTPTVPPAATVPVPPVENLDVVMKGSAPIDVFEIVGAAGQIINSISTNGEIVNITGAPDIISLSAETLGLAKSATGTLVEGNNNPGDNIYPFVQQHNLITANNLVAASARRGLGNISAAQIGTIRANSDGKDVNGVHEGIEGPIVSRHPAGVTNLTGDIVSVNVGEGLRYSGSGGVGFSGIFADGIIDSVTASGAGHDIRGDIVAGGATARIVDQAVVDVNGTPVLDVFGNPVTQSTPTFSIGAVRASGGAAIVDSDIMVVTDITGTVGNFIQSTETNAGLLFFDNPGTLNEPINEIESIRTDGRGGILGTLIAAADIGPIAVNGGFGVINSEITSSGSSSITGIVTDGYGVRSTNITGGASLRQVIANGTGKRLATTSFSSSVRQSEKSAFDADTGMPLSNVDDLHLFLGTTKASPKRKGVSDAGNIEDCQFVGARDLGKIVANRILARNVNTVDPATGQKTKIPPLSLAYPMRIAFGNSTNSIVTRDVIDGLTLTTGSLEAFQPGNDTQHLNINVAGRIKSINALGSLRGSTTIKATGPQGRIDAIATHRSLYATVNASLDIGKISVGRDLGSPSVSTSRNIGTLSVRGSILDGGFVRASKTIGQLIVGKDIKEGATVKAGAINEQSIGGQVSGDIIIT